MAGKQRGLTALEVKALVKPGERTQRHGVGGGLWLQVGPAGAASWLFRYRIGDGRARTVGLGSYPEVGLAAARQLVDAGQALRRRGLDPLVEWRAVQADPSVDAQRVTTKAAGVTFAEAANDYVRAHDGGWSRRHALQWSVSLATHAYPVIGDKAVADVTLDDVLAVLKPIWGTKSETASRVRARIETILAAATVRGLRTGPNPATWRHHLALLLPSRGKVAQVRHHPALDWRRMPDFMTEAAGRPGMVWATLRFVALTAVRSGEARGARWGEIDLATATWTVPARRMKARREHRVPLSAAALAVLREVRSDGTTAPGDLVFPAAHGGMLTDRGPMIALHRSLWRDANGDVITVHGFRSSFRDWCGEATTYPRELAEAALAHTLESRTERAYARGDLFERRRVLMEAWGAHCCGSGAVDRAVWPVAAD